MTRLALLIFVSASSLALGLAMAHYRWPPYAWLVEAVSATPAPATPSGSAAAPTAETPSPAAAGAKTKEPPAKPKAVVGKAATARGYDPRWHAARSATAPAAGTAPIEGSVVPYLQGVTAAPEAVNVQVYEADACHTGLNLLVSGHAPEALLLDMKGNVVHRWSRRFETVFPHPAGGLAGHVSTTYWRRAHLYPNGDLLAIFEGIGIIKLDQDSTPLWSYWGRCHHDMFVRDDGHIFVLTHERREQHPARLVGGAIVEDFVVELSPEGEELRKVSLLDCLLRSRYRLVLARRSQHPDVMHGNTVEILDGRFADRYPMLRENHALISLRNLDLVAVVDLDAQDVTWAMTELWRRQHQPTVVDDGHILLFDNRGKAGKSRVLQFDPLTHDVVWSYSGTAERPLHSHALGSCQRLANGNTLITESEAGRALEVDPSGRVVWEYVNPFRAGEDDELVASLFELIRIDFDDLQFDAVAEYRQAARQGIDLEGLEGLTRDLKR
ncbi:MAG: arylsulfotransferase family protein [Planctomycetota bacterium]